VIPALLAAGPFSLLLNAAFFVIATTEGVFYPPAATFGTMAGNFLITLAAFGFSILFCMFFVVFYACKEAPPLVVTEKRTQ
jgi:hypothetical protein